MVYPKQIADYFPFGSIDKMGDGITTFYDHTSALSSSIESSERVVIASHNEVINTQKVLDECLEQIESLLPESWDPVTGGTNSNDYVLILFSNIKSQSFDSHWLSLYEEIDQRKNLVTSPVSVDFSGQLGLSSINMGPITSNANVNYSFKFSKERDQTQTRNFSMQEQILYILKHFSNLNKKCLLISHSWTGGIEPLNRAKPTK